LELQYLEQWLAVVSFKKIITYIIIVIVLLGGLSLYFFWSPSEYDIFPKCPFYTVTGLHCPGCGIQRGVHDIVNGHIINGIRHNYLILLVTFVLGYKLVLFILEKKTQKTYKNLLHKPITTHIILVLVILFWLLRNINYFPFTELAP